MGAIRREALRGGPLRRRGAAAVGDGRPNLHEAKQVLAQRMWERRNGKFRLTRKAITMAEFIAKWEEDYLIVRQQLGRLKESTLVGYRVNLRLHIGPFFGRMRINEVALPHVREFIKTLLAKKLAPASVLKAVALVKEMFKHAVQWGLSGREPGAVRRTNHDASVPSIRVEHSPDAL